METLRLAVMVPRLQSLEFPLLTDTCRTLDAGCMAVQAEERSFVRILVTDCSGSIPAYHPKEFNDQAILRKIQTVPDWV